MVKYVADFAAVALAMGGGMARFPFAAALAASNADPESLRSHLVPPELDQLRYRATAATTAAAAATTTAVVNTTVQIPTRDGVLLNTYVFLPSESPPHPLPVIMERTPYGASGLGGNAAGWVARGYVGAFWRPKRLLSHLHVPPPASCAVSCRPRPLR
jgi:hypothetical protein